MFRVKENFKISLNVEVKLQARVIVKVKLRII
jgi:hypothetical protein